MRKMGITQVRMPSFRLEETTRAVDTEMDSSSQLWLRKILHRSFWLGDTLHAALLSDWEARNSTEILPDNTLDVVLKRHTTIHVQFGRQGWKETFQMSSFMNDGKSQHFYSVCMSKDNWYTFCALRARSKYIMLVPNMHMYKKHAKNILVASDDFFFPFGGCTLMNSELLLTRDPTISYIIDKMSNNEMGTQVDKCNYQYKKSWKWKYRTSKYSYT